MPKTKITYTDEMGAEHELNEKPFDTFDKLSTSKTQGKSKRPGPGAGYFILVLVLALIMGIAGTFTTLMYLSDNNNLKKQLGLEELNVPISKTEKIKLEESSAITDTVKKVSPAVVSISLTSKVQDFFGRIYEAETGAGTGFIITSDGLIVTNKHVASDEGAEYTVFTADGKDYKAKVVAQDPFNDLAIIKIDASGLLTIELGDSDNVQIGQWVVAVGNALGEFSNTVTVGVLSAIDRQITATGGGLSEKLEGLLQTDAAINPGNSGGPLVNLKGQVIGINTAVAGSAENIGFAIPINVAKKAIESYKKNGKITRPMIGVRYIPLTKEIARANNLSVEAGAWILRGQNYTDVAVIPGSAADKAGLVENDIITAIDGTKIDETHSLARIISEYNVGDEVELTYLRQGEEKKAKLTLTEAQ